MRPQSPTDRSALITCWLAAVVAMAATLGLVAVAQGLVVLASGGDFIGLALPPHLQPWALVNQPALNFSSTTAGTLHFVVGAGACLVLALIAPAILPRPSTMAAEVTMIQVAWNAAVFGLGWIPLVDPWDGHLARALRLAGTDTAILWVLPFIAAMAGLPAVIRLLALARAATPQLLGPQRLGVVLLALVLPTVVLTAGLVGMLTVFGWPETPVDGLAFLAADPRRAALGVVPPCIVALLFAGLRIPNVHAFRLQPADGRSVVVMFGCAALLIVAIVVAGAPRSDGTVNSLLWGSPDDRNNIRPWVDRMPELPSMVP